MIKPGDIRASLVTVFLVSAACVVLAAIAAGCGQEPTVLTTTQPPLATSTTAPYQRKQVDFFRGICEPRPESWQDLVNNAGRLLGDGFNTVSVKPPVLIPQRGGLRPRLILEGEAASAPGIADGLHQVGLAVLIAPTTKSPNLSPRIDATPAILSQLNDDTLKWADTAEQKQAELFAPLDDYNLVMGTTAAGDWSRQILPLIRERYHGPVAAKVVPDLGSPLPGAPHDFEALDYRGYDYLMLDISPAGDTFDQQAFSAYVDDVLTRADAIVQRDGLKGIMIGEFGGWREDSSGESRDGPLLGADGQAAMTAAFLSQVAPRTRGVFFQGWTLPGRGAKGYPVEGELRKFFGGIGTAADTGTATTPAATVTGTSGP